MIKFRIHLKIWESVRKITGILISSRTYLDKMKDNFGSRIGIIAPDFLEKMTVFSSFDPTFPPVPKIWRFHPQKNYIFEIRNIRAIC